MKKSNHFSLEKISNNSYYFTIGERGNGKRYHEKINKRANHKRFGKSWIKRFIKNEKRRIEKIKGR